MNAQIATGRAVNSFSSCPNFEAKHFLNFSILDISLTSFREVKVFPAFLHSVAKTPLQPTKPLSHKPRKSATTHAECNSR